MKAVIYKIYCKDINIVDCYVGQTIRFKRRKTEHRYSAFNHIDLKLYNYINDNGGWNNWIMDIIEELVFDCSKEELFFEGFKEKILDRERFWILHLKATLNTYLPIRYVEEYVKYQNRSNKYCIKIVNKIFGYKNKYGSVERYYILEHFKKLYDINTLILNN
jgi:hypothetical protein